MSEPSATVRRTFLFTDIEGSTRLWDKLPDAMLSVLDRHYLLLGEVIVGAGGQIMMRSGDGVVAVFSSAAAAVEAAIAAQRALGADDFRDPVSLKVRMGVH